MAVFGLPGGSEWIIILAIILLLFGPTQLPKLAKTFGKSAKALKDGMEGKLEETDDAAKSEATKADAEVDEPEK